MNRKYREELFFELVKDKFNIDLRSILSIGGDTAILLYNSALNEIHMKIVSEVKKVHPYAISKGTGKDQRYYTYILDPAQEQRKKVIAPTEQELYKKLFEFYYGEAARLRLTNLENVYEEWLSYKMDVSNRPNTVKRLDQDYQHFYVKEPISEEILITPLLALTKLDIERWAYKLIKKYDMTHKNFSNIFTILKQVMDYMVAKEVLSTNTCTKVKIRSNVFKKTHKKSADTQIFYPDEVEAVVNRAYLLAEETNDESFLAIPLMKFTGVRIAECLGLSFDDFEPESNIVHVHRSFAVKESRNEDGSWATRSYEVQEFLKQNAEPRDVLVADKCFNVVNDIERILEKKGIKREYLFSVTTPNNIQMKLYHICDDLGIQRKSPHKFRKTYISTLLNNHMDPDFVRAQAGHQELQTTLNSYVYSTTRNETQIALLNGLA